MPVLGGGGASFFGSTLTATASGAIADGDPVILNADGTVSAVSANAVVVTPAGETMFVMGYNTDTIYAYDVSTAFDVSTASYSGVSLNVLTQENTPRDLKFNNDGTKLFITGNGGDEINEYDLTSPYDLSTASFSQNFSFASQDTIPVGIAFSNDGTTLVMVGAVNDALFEYDLSTGFDVSTASYSGTSVSILAQGNNPRALAFNLDGTKLFVVEDSAVSIDEYDLSTAFDISTLSYSQSFSISAQESDPGGVAFNSDGTKMFVVGLGANTVFEYDLSTGFDLSTASYSGTSFSVAAQETAATGIVFAGAITATNLTDADAYIGIADGAYADGTTATIQLVGSTDDAQSGLTAGETHYVQTDGSLSTTPDTPGVAAGYAISPTEIVVKGAYSKVTASVIKSVQRGYTSFNGASTDETITAVNLAKSFVVSSVSSNAADNDDALCTARLTTSTNLQLARVNSLGAANVAWEVVEFE